MTREEIAACFSLGIETAEAQLSLRGDYDFNKNLSASTLSIPAAVLIPVLLRDTGPTILFTLRTPHLAAHADRLVFRAEGSIRWIKIRLPRPYAKPERR